MRQGSQLALCSRQLDLFGFDVVIRGCKCQFRFVRAGLGMTINTQNQGGLPVVAVVAVTFVVNFGTGFTIRPLYTTRK